MTYLLLLLTLFGSGTRREVTADCDLIEVNRYVSEGGIANYTQIIIYEWSPDYRRYHVVDWCLYADSSGIQKRNGKYTVRYTSRQSGQRVMFRATKFRETETRHDPERKNAELFDYQLRVKL